MSHSWYSRKGGNRKKKKRGGRCWLLANLFANRLKKVVDRVVDKFWM